jgi:hypothetical protein
MRARSFFFFLGSISMAMTACSSTSGTAADGGSGTDAKIDSAPDGAPADASAGDSEPAGPATIAITSPQDGATVDVSDGEPNIPVAFTVSGFILADPGKCGGMSACGTVWMRVDGDGCNQPLGGVHFNASGSASPIVVHLELCFSGTSGPHTIEASLHDNSGAAVKDGMGKPISSTIRITAHIVSDAGTD